MNFYLIGGVALGLMLPAVWFLIRDWPKESPYLSLEEKNYLAKNNPYEVRANVPVSPSRPGLEALKKVLKVPQIRWFIFIYMAFLSIWYGLLTWLPQYLTVARGFPFTTMGFLSALPYIAGMAGLLFAGFASDRLGKRVPFVLVAFIGASLLLYVAAVTTSVRISVLCLTLATGTISLFIGVFWAMVQTRLPMPLLGLGIGLISGIGNLFSAFAPMFIGYIIQLTGQYMMGIIYMVGFGLAGAACSWVLVRTESSQMSQKLM